MLKARQPYKRKHAPINGLPNGGKKKSKNKLEEKATYPSQKLRPKLTPLKNQIAHLSVRSYVTHPTPHSKSGTTATTIIQINLDQV